MFKSHLQLVEELKQYSSPKARITRMINTKKIIQVKRGIFLDVTDDTYSLNSLSSVVYGPSYISFQSAMSFYGIIPERVKAITCASFNKNKNKFFHTIVGDFYYYYVPTRVYPYCVTTMEENDQKFIIASPEKAICDSLYKVRNITTEEDLINLLVEDWRIDLDVIKNLNRKSFKFLLPLYEKQTCNLFGKWLERSLYA
jgi:predicted transcriptional regulator of viral defense system